MKNDQERAAANLAKVQQERAAAEEALEQLNGRRRFTRRRDRQQVVERLDRAEALEARAESALEWIGQRRARLEEQVGEWTASTAEHGHEARCLRQVDSLIAEQHRRHRPTLGREQSIPRSVEPDIGIDLGL